MVYLADPLLLPEASKTRSRPRYHSSSALPRASPSMVCSASVVFSAEKAAPCKADKER